MCCVSSTWRVLKAFGVPLASRRVSRHKDAKFTQIYRDGIRGGSVNPLLTMAREFRLKKDRVGWNLVGLEGARGFRMPHEVMCAVPNVFLKLFSVLNHSRCS